jgi:tyrosyl-tRNA synthetase
MKLYDELKWRGLVKDCAGDDLEKRINEGGLTFYWGTDPTADSLHLGHYSSLVTAKRLAKGGHHPILLVGGATGLIGDPRPTAEREIIAKEALLKNQEGIRKQVERIVPGAQMVNNYDWMKDFTFLDFLRDVGKYISINYMLDKDIIRRRLETGITYAEFSYTLMQGYDFLYLYEHYNCEMQVAGSDQWGNITTGIDLISKQLGKSAYGFTMPLVVDKYGKKFGKTEGNALWLDINKTTSYEMYQYLINTDDDMAIPYLKLLTFLSKEQIDKIEKEAKEKPEERIGQKALAREIITDLHGKEEYEKALKISESLFTDKITELSANDILNNMKDVPNFIIKENTTLLDILINNKICSSKREARELLTAGAITINNKKITDENYLVGKKDAIESKVILLKKGKKNYFIGKIN